MYWFVRDFKGISSARLNIGEGNTTILTGVNSSGKSSIIQSLLLVAQSLHNDGHMVLNGPLVRLGDAGDLVREGTDDNALGLGFTFDPTIMEDLEDFSDVNVEYSLLPAQEGSSLEARDLHLTLCGEDPESRHEVLLSQMNVPKKDREQVLAIPRRTSLEYGHVLRLRRHPEGKRPLSRTYVEMEGMRPVRIVRLMQPNAIRQRYEAMLAEAMNNRAYSSSFSGLRGSLFGAYREFFRFLHQAYAESADEFPTSIAEILQDSSMGRGFGYLDERWTKLVEEDKRKILRLAAAQRAKRPYVSIDIDSGSRSLYGRRGLLENALQEQVNIAYSSLAALSYSLTLLSKRVQYIGPLRDEPRVVWNHWNELGHGLPVGSRGEYSAAVLSRDSGRLVAYARPNKESAVSKLSAAVDEWLSFLSIGDKVTPSSHGKLGVGLDIQVNGKVRDLTAVGVGVSQALPLVVGFLGAPQNSIFIIEQPELHLHPAVQARLADFFLVARPDVAVIVETHSESLITRIRRRAAEGTSNGSEVDIIFVEPDADGSIARHLEISEFGDLSEWPEGFLSTGEDDVKAILEAGLRRMKYGIDA
jgi:predicted ATPase